MDSDRFIANLKSIADQNQIRIIAQSDVTLPNSNEACSGYFSSKLKELKYNPNHSNYLEILVHESCHLDQFIENSILWSKFNSLPSLTAWFSHDFQMDMDEINTFKDILLNTELDCELRSIEKIKNYKLNIDNDLYIKKANAYLYALDLSFKYRKWIVTDPSTFNDIIKKMPSSLSLNFDVSLEETFKKCFA